MIFVFIQTRINCVFAAFFYLIKRHFTCFTCTCFTGIIIDIYPFCRHFSFSCCYIDRKARYKYIFFNFHLICITYPFAIFIFEDQFNNIVIVFVRAMFSRNKQFCTFQCNFHFLIFTVNITNDKTWFGNSCCFCQGRIYIFTIITIVFCTDNFQSNITQIFCCGLIQLPLCNQCHTCRYCNCFLIFIICIRRTFFTQNFPTIKCMIFIFIQTRINFIFATFYYLSKRHFTSFTCTSFTRVIVDICPFYWRCRRYYLISFYIDFKCIAIYRFPCIIFINKCQFNNICFISIFYMVCRNEQISTFQCYCHFTILNIANDITCFRIITCFAQGRIFIFTVITIMRRTDYFQCNIQIFRFVQRPNCIYSFCTSCQSNSFRCIIVFFCCIFSIRPAQEAITFSFRNFITA